MKFAHKDLLSLQMLPKEEIEHILETAISMKEIIKRKIKKVPTLRGKTMVNLFYEPSTRTRVSFELAAKYLSCDTINISPQTSSIAKGESLQDTIKTLEAMGVSLVVVRHSQAGVPHMLAGMSKMGIINAGDGAHEHPTQGLLDLFTIREYKNKIENLNVLIVGDILHSRVARSDIWGLRKLGANVCVCGPPTLIPMDIERLSVQVSYNVDEWLGWADVVIVLRLQFERQDTHYIPHINEYKEFFCLTTERARLLKKDALIMHPGPINRDIEIAGEVVDSAHSVITQQVTNGIAIRMSVLYLLSCALDAQ